MFLRSTFLVWISCCIVNFFVTNARFDCRSKKKLSKVSCVNNQRGRFLLKVSMLAHACFSFLLVCILIALFPPSRLRACFCIPQYYAFLTAYKLTLFFFVPRLAFTVFWINAVFSTYLMQFKVNCLFLQPKLVWSFKQA